MSMLNDMTGLFIPDCVALKIAFCAGSVHTQTHKHTHGCARMHTHAQAHIEFFFFFCLCAR